MTADPDIRRQVDDAVRGDPMNDDNAVDPETAHLLDEDVALLVGIEERLATVRDAFAQLQLDSSLAVEPWRAALALQAVAMGADARSSTWGTDTEVPIPSQGRFTAIHDALETYRDGLQWLSEEAYNTTLFTGPPPDTLERLRSKAGELREMPAPGRYFGPWLDATVQAFTSLPTSPATLKAMRSTSQQIAAVYRMDAPTPEDFERAEALEDELLAIFRDEGPFGFDRAMDAVAPYVHMVDDLGDDELRFAHFFLLEGADAVAELRARLTEPTTTPQVLLWTAFRAGYLGAPIALPILRGAWFARTPPPPLRSTPGLLDKLRGWFGLD